VASTGALLACGGLETRRPLAPINAISHWYWGDRAALRNRFSLRHTVAGYITHHAASIFWATFFEKWFGERRREGIGARELADAALVSAMACFVDYQMTPRRLTPGFELRLSRASLFAVYAAFAVGLAVGGKPDLRALDRGRGESALR
jgi:hypothetical protein